MNSIIAIILLTLVNCINCNFRYIDNIYFVQSPVSTIVSGAIQISIVIVIIMAIKQ